MCIEIDIAMGNIGQGSVIYLYNISNYILITVYYLFFVCMSVYLSVYIWSLAWRCSGRPEV